MLSVVYFWLQLIFMINAEASFARIPAWTMILTAALVAASGHAFLNEDAFVGVAIGVLGAFLLIKWHEMPFAKRLFKSVGWGMLVGVCTYPLSIALCYVVGFVDGFVHGFKGAM